MNRLQRWPCNAFQKLTADCDWSLLVSEKLEIVLRQRLPEMIHSPLYALAFVRRGIRLATLGKLLITQELSIHLPQWLFQASEIMLWEQQSTLTPFVEILVPVLARLIPFLCALRFWLWFVWFFDLAIYTWKDMFHAKAETAEEINIGLEKSLKFWTIKNLIELCSCISCRYFQTLVCITSSTRTWFFSECGPGPPAAWCFFFDSNSGMSCPSWRGHRTGCRRSLVRTLPLPPVAFATVAPLWCDLPEQSWY